METTFAPKLTDVAQNQSRLIYECQQKAITGVPRPEMFKLFPTTKTQGTVELTNFGGTMLHKLNINGMTFVHCDFRGTVLDESTGDNVTFDNCMFDEHTTMTRFHAHNSRWINSPTRNVDMAGADFTGAKEEGRSSLLLGRKNGTIMPDGTTLTDFVEPYRALPASIHQTDSEHARLIPSEEGNCCTCTVS